MMETETSDSKDSANNDSSKKDADTTTIALTTDMTTDMNVDVTETDAVDVDGFGSSTEFLPTGHMPTSSE